MGITQIILIVVAAFALVYDIWAAVMQRKGKKINNKLVLTISRVMHGVYKKFPFTPLVVGVIFGGHFDNPFNLAIPAWLTVVALVLAGVPVLVWSIISLVKKSQKTFYKVSCRFSIIWLSIGYLVGAIFWPLH